jgi:hypothetical protein
MACVRLILVATYHKGVTTSKNASDKHTKFKAILVDPGFLKF